MNDHVKKIGSAEFRVELVARHTPVVSSAVALQKCMALAGWEISYIDLDLTGERPAAEIRLKRNDGRWLFARVDRLGRACFETFQRELHLGMSRNTKGRRPQCEQIDDVFLGRHRFEGARSMLRGMTSYLADNALHPVALSDMRAAWASVMGAPLRLAVDASSREGS